MAKETRNVPLSRVILTDIPSENDEFSGGGHQRTANALADAIIQFEGADRAIGLEGSWGSGKSTIVELAKKALATTDQMHNYHVFTFDLWANQTGHFKRSFLESFLSWASTTFPAEGRFFKAKKSQVGDRKQTVTTNSSRRFSWFGVSAIVFLYFSPLIYAWLTPAAFTSAAGEPAIRVGALLAWLAIALMSLILIWAVCEYWPDKGERLDKLQSAVSRTFSIFSKEAEVTEIEQNIRDEDPTKFEFTKIFREIVARLQQKSDRIVVVFDNIDRLPSDRIADQWSEVRSAFYSDHSGLSGETQITAIVPYARSVTLAAVAAGEKGKDRAAYIDADFFRKSFDAIFLVSPPILSDAATFFKKKFLEATSGHSDDQAAASVYRIFDLQVQMSGHPHTPRQVIAFINDLTGWWVQWNGQIPLETIAVFVAHQSELVTNPGVLRKEGAIDPRMMRHANQNELIRDIAALAYNVPPSMALQVLSHDAIRKALTADGADQLRELVEAAPGNGFSEILIQVVDEHASEWAQEPATALAPIVSNLTAVEESPSFSYTKRVIQSQADNLADIPTGVIEKTDAIWDIVSFATADEVNKVTIDLVAWLNRSLPQSDKQDVDHGRQWIKIVGKLLDRVEHHHGKSTRDAILPKIAIPTGPKAIIGAGIDCDETNYHLRQFSSLANLKSSIADALVEIAQDDQLFYYAWNELSYLFGDKEKLKLLSIPIGFLKEKVVEAGSDQLSYAVRNISGIYSSISSVGRPKGKVAQELFQSGAAIHYAYAIHQNSEGKDPDALTSLFWLSMEELGPERASIPNVQGVPIFGNIQAAFNWFYEELETDEVPSCRSSKIAKLAAKNGRVTHYIKNAARETAQQKMFVDVLRQLLNESGFRIPSFNVFVQNFSSLKTNLGEDIEKFYAAIGANQSEEFWSEIAFDKLPSTLVSIAVERNEPGWKTFLKNLDEWLYTIEADKWRDALAINSNTVTLLRRRGIDSSYKIPAANFYEPILEGALSIISGTAESPFDREEFEQLVDCLPANSQRQFPKDLYKRHSAHTDGISEALATFPGILASLPFETDATKSIEAYLLPLLKENSKAADDFIISKKDSFLKVLKSADDARSGLVSEFLEDAHEDKTKSERSRKLRGSLGLTVTSEVPEE